MENMQIMDEQITVSSRNGNNLMVYYGRLNLLPGNISMGTWSVQYGNDQQWLQVDFKKKMAIGKVATQGRGDQDEWVISYSLSYSLDANQFEEYKHCGHVKVRFYARHDITFEKLEGLLLATKVRRGSGDVTTFFILLN